MDAVVAVGRLALGSLEFVGRVWHVAVRGSLVGLPGSPATQRLVGVVKRAPHLGEALVSCVVEPAARLRSPQLVFLGHQFFDPIKDGLFFHTASIMRRDRRLPGARPGDEAVKRSGDVAAPGSWPRIARKGTAVPNSPPPVSQRT